MPTRADTGRGRRILGVALATLAASVLVGASPVSAQPATGTITGRVLRVVDENTQRPQEGVQVILTGGRTTSDGGSADPVTESTTTDAKGRYRFTELPAGPDRFYALDARYDGGVFAGGAVSLDEGDVIRTTLRVWRTTSHPGGLLVRTERLFVIPGEGDVDVIHSLTLVNPTDRAYVDPPGAGTRRRPSFTIPLPPDAAENGVRVVDASFDIPALVETPDGVGITVAIPPGERTLTLAYQVSGTAGVYDFSRRLAYDTAELSFFAASPLVARSDRLTRGGNETIQGRNYTEFASTGDFDPGDVLQVELVAQAETSSGWFMWGLTGLAAALLLFTFFVFRRGRRPARVSPSRKASESRVPREELVTAIASLDLEYEEGKVSEPEWRARRDRLKRALGDGSGKEPA